MGYMASLYKHLASEGYTDIGQPVHEGRSLTRGEEYIDVQAIRNGVRYILDITLSGGQYVSHDEAVASSDQ